jgi:hypothetical protein
VRKFPVQLLIATFIAVPALTLAADYAAAQGTNSGFGSSGSGNTGFGNTGGTNTGFSNSGGANTGQSPKGPKPTTSQSNTTNLLDGHSGDARCCEDASRAIYSRLHANTH